MCLYAIQMKIKWKPPYFLVTHHPDIELQYIWFDSSQDRAWWVSAITEKDSYLEKWYANEIKFTLLFRNVSAIYSAPASPIWFQERKNLVNVCEYKKDRLHVNKWKMQWRSPCYILMHVKDIEPQHLLFDCF